jgi:hypothetical protein
MLSSLPYHLAPEVEMSGLSNYTQLQPRCGVHAVKSLFGPFTGAVTSIPSFAFLRASLVYICMASLGPQESEALADYVIQLR